MRAPEAKFWAVIPAAGVGRRMGAARPKQYLQLAGRSVIEHTLERFLNHPGLRGVVVAVGDGDPYWPQLKHACDARIARVAGGTERADSVRNALLALSDRAAGSDWVLVHDAARPCLAAEDLTRLLQTLQDHPVGGILGTPARDTMKRVNAEGEIEATVDRTTLWHALTPQMFRLAPLLRSLELARENGWTVTDEASAVEQAGLKPRIVEGRADNIKITRPEDLAYAEWLLHRSG
ncbi:MAG: 2-C-methyl-D-erythritol 4-phosphate cytidylyltransferase [Acidihalobacter sp.]